MYILLHKKKHINNILYLLFAKYDNIKARLNKHKQKLYFQK